MHQKNKLLIGMSMMILIILAPASFSLTYNEKITSPSMINNDYSIAVSNFIKEKCGNCKDVMIIGDDFVVPGYRRHIPLQSWQWFTTYIEEKPIYTDILYTSRTEKPFSELDDLFKFKGTYYGKKLKYIYPNNIDSELKNEIKKLNQTLSNKYNPVTEYIPSEQVTCNDVALLFSKFRSSTVIVIGTEENNIAFSCFPFIADESNEDSAFIEVNPWDYKNYAILINTENPFVIETLDLTINKEAYKHLKSKNWWYLELGLEASVYAAMVADYALATPAIPIDFIGDGLDSLNDCIVRGDALYCKIGLGAMALPWIPSKLVKAAIKKFIDAAGKPAIDLLTKYTKEVLQLFADLARKGKVDDFIDTFKKATIDGGEKGFKLGEDIFNFMRKKVIRFDDEIAKGTKNVDELTPKLSENAKKVFDGSKYSGAGEKQVWASEAVSFANFEKRGGKLKYVEKDIGDGFDYVVEISGENYPVQVKRVVSQTPTRDSIYGEMKKTLKEMNEGVVDLPKDKYAKDATLHYLTKNSNEIKLVEEAFEKGIKEGKTENIKLVISSVPDYIMKGG